MISQKKSIQNERTILPGVDLHADKLVGSMIKVGSIELLGPPAVLE